MLNDVTWYLIILWYDENNYIINYDNSSKYCWCLSTTVGSQLSQVTESQTRGASCVVPNFESHLSTVLPRGTTISSTLLSLYSRYNDYWLAKELRLLFDFVM